MSETNDRYYPRIGLTCFARVSVRGLYFLAALTAAFLPIACNRNTPPSMQDVTLETADGAAIQASFCDPGQANSAALVLVHDKLGSRRNWAAVTHRLQQAGYLTLAIDLRGHGGSNVPAGRPTAVQEFSTQDWLAASNDIAAAIQFILKRGADPKRIAVAGEGFGAALSLYYAAKHPEVAALVLVSPNLDEPGIDSREEIAAVGKRPVLLLAAETDAYAATSCLALKKSAVGLCELRQYPGGAHGTALFDASETAQGQLIQWLDQMVQKAVDSSPR